MTDFKEIALAEIKPSPFNARKTFDGIDELAASIKERGLLENLVVRPIYSGEDQLRPSHYELVAGERRLRALRKLEFDTAPCRVIKADDGAAMAAQIVENLQREDIKPMEEAKAFADLQDLDHKTWTPQAIAKAIGKTDRFVQQRVQMARNLSAKAQKALADGDLKVEQARTLAMAPRPVQDQLLDEFDPLDLESMPTNELRDHILESMVPTDVAAFDIALYKGGYHEEGKKRFFTDVEQFNKLQAKAAQDLAAKLAEEWPGAKVVERIERFSWCWGDTGDYIGYSPETKKKATGPLKIAKERLTALVCIDQGRVKSVEGVAPQTAFPRKAASAGGYVGVARETAEQRRYRQAYNAAVFEAVAAKPDFALRVLLVRFIDGTTRFSYDHTEQRKGHEAILPRDLLDYVNSSFQHSKTVKLWEAVKKLKADDVARMIAQYTARSLSWHSMTSYGSGKKPPEFTALLAEETKAKLPQREVAKKPTAKAKAKPKAAAKKKSTPKAKAKTKKKGGRK